MSFLAEFHTIVTDLEAEGHALAAKAKGLFGTSEKLIAGIVSELRPAIAKDVADLLALAKTDSEQLAEQAVSDLKAELAAIKALLQQTVTPAPAPAPAVPPAQG